MALGAQPDGVVRLVVREGMTVGLIGIAAGLAARVDPLIALRDE